ncbi:hypothetical protein ACFUGD_31650 [Streptomyces sp. NPDC057217]
MLGDGGHWLLDIRPAGLVGELDAVKFAAQAFLTLRRLDPKAHTPA